MTEKSRPNVNAEGQKQLSSFEDQFEGTLKSNSETMKKAIQTPSEDKEGGREISNYEKQNEKEIYLKPVRMIGSREKFNEKYRKQYEWSNEYVPFQAVNNEIQGETIEMWTKPFPGLPALYWHVPVGKRVFGPRYLAEQLTKCKYSVMTMENKALSTDSSGTYYGAMAVTHTKNRVNALPETTKSSVFMTA